MWSRGEFLISGLYSFSFGQGIGNRQTQSQTNMRVNIGISLTGYTPHEDLICVDDFLF